MRKIKAIISNRFEKAVLLHIIKNYHPGNRHVPLIMGIHGPSGEGKTYQCSKILEKHDIKSFFISGGQLENPHAGMPAQIIREQYLNAGKHVNTDSLLPAVLLINDIDAGIGNWGELVQTTVNTQNVCAELMNLVDEPTKVNEKNTPRIPIIVTGNDFSKLYLPLVRAGRMSSFEWIPTTAEKVQILESMYPEFSQEEIIYFLSKLNTIIPDKSKFYLSIAFYSQLRSTLYDEMLWDFVYKKEASNILRKLIKGDKIDFPELSISIDDLLEKAAILAKNGIFNNHLKQ